MRPITRTTIRTRVARTGARRARATCASTAAPRGPARTATVRGGPGPEGAAGGRGGAAGEAARGGDPPAPNGFALITVLILLIVASVLVTVAVRGAITEQISGHALRAEGAARYAAESGANVLWAEWPASFESVAPGDSAVLAWRSLPDGSAFRGALHRVDDGGAQKLRVLRVTGRGPGPRSGEHVVELWSTEGRFPFRYGMSAKDEIEIKNGSRVDSYHSGHGPYDPGTAGSDGHISSNGKIEVRSGSTVDGDASATDDIDSGGGTITGTETEGSDEIDLPAVDCPTTGYSSPLSFSGSDYDYNPLNGELEVDAGGEVILPGGTYFFNEVKLSPNSQIRPAPGEQVVVYISKEMKLMNGAEVNSVGQNPADFQMYGCGTEGADFRFQNNNKVYGPVYSPEFEVELSGNSELWGSFIGWKVKVDGSSAVHWDAALFDVEGPGGVAVRTRLSRPWTQILR